VVIALATLANDAGIWPALIAWPHEVHPASIICEAI